jgi:hypothetical protein
MGKSKVPASKLRGRRLKRDTPQSTIFAEEAIFDTINTVTNRTITRSKYLYSRLGRLGVVAFDEFNSRIPLIRLILQK